MNALTIPPQTTENYLPITLQTALETAAGLASNSRAASTRAAYSSDWKVFSAWCAAHGLCSMPADTATVACWVASEAARGIKSSTLGRRLAAVAFRHKQEQAQNPCDDPRVKAVLAGAKRTLGTAPNHRAPVLVDALKDIVRGIAGDMKGLRDKALLLVCWCGALRRSDLIQMDVEHIEFTAEGMRLLIPRSKTDQTGEGQTIAILRSRNPVYCPVAALQAWLAAAKVESGAIWRRVRKGGHVGPERLTGHAVCVLVKEYAAAVGIDPATVGGHSLRSGPLSSAAANGASIAKLKELSRHKSTDILLNHYVMPAALFTDHCLTGML